MRFNKFEPRSLSRLILNFFADHHHKPQHYMGQGIQECTK